MFTFLMSIHILASLVLIGVILIQAGRGGGVSDVFGGSSTNTIFGTSTEKFLTKTTAVCAALFIITSLSLAVLSSKRSKSLMESKPARLMDLKGKKAEPRGQEINIPAKDEKKTAVPKSE